MAAITQVWDSSYENIPADNDQASEGALRIRNLKRDIRERAEVDHDWDDTTDAGKHLQVVFRDPLGADPGDVVDEGVLYTKNVSTKAELFWKDEDGNVLQLTFAGAAGAFPTGTRMVFQQAAAPTGWTKDVTAALDDHALRVVTTTAFTAGSLGTNSFSATLGGSAGVSTDGYTLLTADIPGHTHASGSGNANMMAASTSSVIMNRLSDPGGSGDSDFESGSITITTSTATASTGGDGAHSHTLSVDIQFVDLIIATKD